jgi:hypothetical protein
MPRLLSAWPAQQRLAPPPPCAPTDATAPATATSSTPRASWGTCCLQTISCITCPRRSTSCSAARRRPPAAAAAAAAGAERARRARRRLAAPRARRRWRAAPRARCRRRHCTRAGGTSTTCAATARPARRCGAAGRVRPGSWLATLLRRRCGCRPAARRPQSFFSPGPFSSALPNPPASPSQNNFLPGRSDGGDYKAQVVAMKVVASRGFEFHEHQLHGNTKRLKPGW